MFGMSLKSRTATLVLVGVAVVAVVFVLEALGDGGIAMGVGLAGLVAAWLGVMAFVVRRFGGSFGGPGGGGGSGGCGGGGC